MYLRRFTAWCCLAVLFAIILLSPGCRTSHTSDPVPTTGPTTTTQPAGLAGFLPGPAALLAIDDAPRATAYLETDFIKHGSEYSASLPNLNIQAGTDNSVEFLPSWSDAGGNTPANLAFCIYRYTITGYDRTAELRYQWLIQPPSYGSVWFGLSNWLEDSWDWVVCEADGDSAFGESAPYFNGSGVLYVVVACANDGDNVLRHLRIGNLPGANIELELSPPYPHPDTNVTLSLAGSYLPVGTTEAYAWDLDANGSFEIDTGAVAETTTVYDTAGGHPLNVRLTSSYREYYTAALTAEIIGAWDTSWGTDLYQDIQAITTDGWEFCYSAGCTATASDPGDALLLKHTLGGELVWASSWGGPGLDALTDVYYDDGRIYTVGKTNSYGAGNYDILIQRWNDDGWVDWSRTVGTGGAEVATGVAFVDDELYIAGNRTSSGNTNVFLLKFGVDNTYKWARTWGGSGDDEAMDILALGDINIFDHELLVTGHTDSPNPLYQDVFFLQFDTGGNPTIEKTWRSDTETTQAGLAINGGPYYDFGHIVIGGYLGEGSGRRALLLPYGSSYPTMLKAWSCADECLAYDILYHGDHYFMAGLAGEFGVSSAGFVVEFDYNGELLNESTWADGDPGTGFTALCNCPGGLLAAGNCQAATAGAWSDVSGTVTSPAGTWSDFSATSGSILLSFSLPTPTVQKITTGVENTGGGSWDALAAVVDFPE